MKQRGLIVIDLQNEYLPTGKLPLSGIEAAVANAVRILADAREQGIPVFHIRHEFSGSEAPFFVPGTDGVNIMPAVAPAENEPVISTRSARRISSSGWMHRVWKRSSLSVP